MAQNCDKSALMMPDINSFKECCKMCCVVSTHLLGPCFHLDNQPEFGLCLFRLQVRLT